MKRRILKQKGFTLIELLVVMAIVAILSTLAVGSYTRYRKAALIDLNTDNLISQIMEMRAKAIYKDNNALKLEEIKSVLSGSNGGGGQNGGAGQAPAYSSTTQCYGIQFVPNSNGKYIISAFNSDFDKKKEFNINTGVWEYKGCGKNPDGSFSVNESALTLALDDQIFVKSISVDGTQINSTFALSFAPPNGKMEVSEVDGLGTVNLVLQYGEGENPEFQKQIDIDVANANFTKKNVQN